MTNRQLVLILKAMRHSAFLAGITAQCASAIRETPRWEAVFEKADKELLALIAEAEAAEEAARIIRNAG